MIIYQLTLLLSFINDIIDMKRIEQGTFHAKPESFNPTVLLQLVMDLFQLQSQTNDAIVSFQATTASASKIALHCCNFTGGLFPEADLPDQLYGDMERLKQVLIILVENAIKHTRKGTVKILVSHDESSNLLEQQVLRVHVVDDGDGLSPET